MRFTSEVLPQRQTATNSRALRIDRHDTILAVPLRAVERKVRSRHQLVCAPRLRERRNAEACRDLDLLYADRNDKVRDGDTQVLGERLRPHRVGLRQEDRELLSPEPRREVDAADPPLQ